MSETEEHIHGLAELSSTVAHLSERRSITPLVDVVAGSIGGICGTIVGQPFDVVKVRLQSDSSASPMSLVSTVRHTWKAEGVAGFWRGVLPPVFAEAMINTVYFGTYAVMQRVFQADPNIPLTTTQASIAGAISGITGTFIVAPAELIKIRLQVGHMFTSHNEFVRTTMMASSIFKEEGLKGFSRGFGVTLLREVPCIALYFGLYEYFKKTFRDKNGHISVPGQLCAGGLAGSGSWILTYPLDVIKTRIQANDTHGTIRHCVTELWKNKGIGGFYKGVIPCALRAFPVNAVIFAIYEWCVALSWKFVD